MSRTRRLVFTAAGLMAAVALLPGCYTGRKTLDESTQKWVRLLKSGDKERRATAARILSAKRGKELLVVPPLIEALGDRDPVVAKSAAEALRMLLAKPDISDQRTAWEEYWRRAKKKYETRSKQSPDQRIKTEKAALENDRGFLYLGQGRYKLAEGHFLEAVALDPDDPKYWNNLGKCRMSMGMLPDAVDAFRTSLDKDATYGLAHYNLGEAFLQITEVTGNDRTYEALGHAEAAIKIDKRSKDWAARWLKARILFRMAMGEPRPAERAMIYQRAWEAVSSAIGIVELTRRGPEIAQVRKTAALVAYGRELYYRAYKEVKRVYDLGYQMDRGFMSRLEEALRREAYKSGADMPVMPTSKGGDASNLPPPALRLPYGEGD